MEVMKDMNPAIKKTVRAACAADPSIDDEQTEHALAVLEGRMVSEKTEGPLLATQAEVARALRCSRYTVHRLVSTEKLPVVCLRGLRRYRWTDVKALIGLN